MIRYYSLTPWAFTNENHVARLFAAHRQETGSHVNRAYVYDDNRVIAFCHHKHRRAATAKACAKRMLRDLVPRSDNSRRET